jgi:hypothetical protein
LRALASSTSPDGTNSARKIAVIKHLLSIFLVALLVILSSTTNFAAPSKTPSFNQDDFKALIQEVESTTGPLGGLKNLSDYHIVLVGGFLNEIAPAYFQKTVYWLEKYGAANITVLMPSSGRTVEENIIDLNASFKEIHSKNPGQKILAIGHSKGGAELMAMLMAYPELITQNIIRSIITVQAPVSGCFLPTCTEKLLGWAKMIPFISGGLSLTDSEIDRLILEPLKNIPPATRKILSDHIFYVLSQQNPENTALAITIPNNLIRRLSENPENDGLVEMQRMFIENFGRILGTLEADHMELLVALSLRGLLLGLNTSTDAKNHAFIYMLIKTFLDIAKKQDRARALACKRLFN